MVELIDTASGTVVATWDYSPYGEITGETGTVQADFGYTGHFYDADLALHHAPFRVYDASLGRWLSADPLPDAELLPEGTNLYAYVGNDPINYVDPLGLCKSGPSNNSKNSRATPPRQGGGNGTGNGGPPKRTASSASPQDPGDGGKGLSNSELFRKAGQKAFDRIAGKGGSVGTARHEYATKLLQRYQKMFGDRGLRFKEPRIRLGKKSILDVRDKISNTIYDWKFGNAARMSRAQQRKYRQHYPDHAIQVEKYLY